MHVEDVKLLVLENMASLLRSDKVDLIALGHLAEIYKILNGGK